MNVNEEMQGSVSKRLRMPICDRFMSNEISNDYSLPDYQPEIRRLLHISANIIPPAKYVSTSGAEFNGMVDYTIMYVGADGELYTLPLSAEYSFNFPIDADTNYDFNEGVNSIADIVSENIITRLSGPRRLNIKCRLKCHARAYAVMVMDERMIGDVNAGSIQRLEQSINCCSSLRCATEPFTQSTEIIPEYDNMRVIGAQGKLFVSDVSLYDSNANIRGEINLSLLCQNEDKGEIVTVNRRVPFSENIEGDEIKKESICCARGYVNDIAVNVEDRRIVVDIGAIAELELQSSEMVTYTQDIYSTENECECQYRDYKIPHLGYCTNGNFSFNERLARDNIGFPTDAQIIDSYAQAIADGVTYRDGKSYVGGQIKVTTILKKDDEYTANEIMLPLKYEFDGGKENMNSGAILDVISCRVRQDAESVSIDAEIYVSVWGVSSEEIIALNEVRFIDELKKSSRDIVVCYPSTSDTLWSVAKKYHVPISRIEHLNGISDSICDKKYLIV